MCHGTSTFGSAASLPASESSLIPACPSIPVPCSFASQRMCPHRGSQIRHCSSKLLPKSMRLLGARMVPDLSYTGRKTFFPHQQQLCEYCLRMLVYLNVLQFFKMLSKRAGTRHVIQRKSYYMIDCFDWFASPYSLSRGSFWFCFAFHKSHSVFLFDPTFG